MWWGGSSHSAVTLRSGGGDRVKYYGRLTDLMTTRGGGPGGTGGRAGCGWSTCVWPSHGGKRRNDRAGVAVSRGWPEMTTRPDTGTVLKTVKGAGHCVTSGQWAVGPPPPAAAHNRGPAVRSG